MVDLPRRSFLLERRQVMGIVIFWTVIVCLAVALFGFWPLVALIVTALIIGGVVKAVISS